MRQTMIIMLFLLLCSCKSKTDNKDEDSQPHIGQQTNETEDANPYRPEYPLIGFWYNKTIKPQDNTINKASNSVNDLFVDSLKGLIVSFDLETPCDNAIIEGYMAFNPQTSDTVYLEYLIKCKQKNNANNKDNKVRLFYKFTDDLSYKWRPFIPRQKKE